MTPTNLAELPGTVLDAFGQRWQKQNPDGTAWSQPGPPGAVPHPVPFDVLAKRAPLTHPDTGHVLVQKPADDLTAAEAWQDEHEAETGHRTYRCNPSWSGATSVVNCAGHGTERCDETFRYRNTRDPKETTNG